MQYTKRDGTSKYYTSATQIKKTIKQTRTYRFPDLEPMEFYFKIKTAGVW